MTTEFNLSKMMGVITGKIKIEPIFKSKGFALDCLLYCIIEMEKKIEDLEVMLSKKIVYQIPNGN